MLLLPLVILTLWLLHVQTKIYSQKEKIIAAFVPDGFESIPQLQRLLKAFSFLKQNCPAHWRSQGARPPPPPPNGNVTNDKNVTKKSLVSLVSVSSRMRSQQ